MTELYSVVVMRRGQPGQISLHFKSRDAANYALATVRGMATIGGVPKHELLKDDFGNKVDFDPQDMGTICFIDVPKALEQQAIQAQMTNRVNIGLQEKAKREQVLAQSRGGVLIPANASAVPS